MATVRVQPSGAMFDVEPDETVIAAAWRSGYTWPTVCQGQGTCRTCVLEVVSGADQLSEPDRFEREGLALVTAALPGDPAGYRLACQVRVRGDVVVTKLGVRPAPG